VFSGLFRPISTRARQPAGSNGYLCKCYWTVGTFFFDSIPSQFVKYADSFKTDNFINAYDEFWDLLGAERRRGDPPNLELLRSELLDINPEGYLSKEIKDVLDELYSIRYAKSN
jgi:hypothetical protein